jgi:hypothetical protein
MDRIDTAIYSEPIQTQNQMKPSPILLIVAVAPLFTPLASLAQTTIFQDTFANGSSINPSSVVVPTSDSTAYEIASSKNASSTTLSGGLLTLSTSATSSGYTEAQAQFTATPVTLATAGDYIEVYYTFNDTANLFNGNAGNAMALVTGLYNSGGTGLADGSSLWSTGLSSGSSTVATGNAQSWVGYSGNIAYGLGSSPSGSAIQNRQAQTGANNLNQGLGEGSGYATPGPVNLTTQAGVAGSPTLTIGNTYTVALKLTYNTATSLGVAETLFNGAGISGTTVDTYSGAATGVNVLTDTFDSLDVGYRPATSPSTATTVPISDITVLDNIQAVPEPSTFALTGFGMLSFVWMYRRPRH